MLNNSLVIVFICFIIVTCIIVIVRKYKPKEEKKEIIEEPKIKKETLVVNTELPEEFDVKEFEIEIKKLYMDLQKYFSILDYDNIKRILDVEIYKQYETQMKYLEKNNKYSIKDNIEFIDFKINDYDNKSIKVSIGVLEDKYTKYINNDNYKPLSYENYYELEIVLRNRKYIIKNLKLLYSHSKKR